MRRVVTFALLLALMAGFAFGVNRFFASRRNAHIPKNAAVPTATRAAFALPGVIVVAQHGKLYRLERGTFTDLHIPPLGTWMQPSAVPGNGEFIAVLRSAAFSDLYAFDGSGHLLRQLSHNATSRSTIQLNHWMFWPRVAADGQTVYVSYDSPKSQSSYEIDFAIWSSSLSGRAELRQWTDPNAYTGGDVQAVPLGGGGLLYSKYEIGNGQVYSRLVEQTQPLGTPSFLTAAADDCSSPALSPDGTQLAMVCAGGSGLQSTRLEVASLIGTKLGVPRVLVSNCLCASPAWAPDGSGLVYYAPADVSGHFELWWIAGAGGPLPKSPKQVTQTLDLDATSPPAWSAT